jgi:hypothetical protein
MRCFSHLSNDTKSGAFNLGRQIAISSVHKPNGQRSEKQGVQTSPSPQHTSIQILFDEDTVIPISKTQC